MDIDFTALASRVAARAEVLGCVILSRDGLVMGAFPPGGERDVTPAWLRFAAVGDPERGFVQFSGELWAYVRRGPYAAFAVGSAGTRAGILLDYLEQALLAAEDSRDQRAAVRRPETVDLNREHFGSILPSERPPQPVAASPPWSGVAAPPQPSGPIFEPMPSVLREPPSPSEPVETATAAGYLPGVPEEAAPAPPAFPAPETADAGATAEGPSAFLPAPTEEDDDEEPFDDSQTSVNPEDIDRVALAREFAQLLQDGPFGVEDGRI
ncbi:MAG: hypothetical protein M3Q23_10315 [Actinomycetota bacterium]|nr:hypothetical protein [Actinomycetota bacterium]